MRPDLVRAALVGVATQPVTGGGGASDSLVASAVPGASSERRLLLTAGIEAARARAGHLPPAAPPSPSPAPPDTLPECSPRAAALLAEIVEQSSAELLAEAAGRLRATGRRVPASMVPDLIGAPLWPNGGILRDALRPVLGERGRWVAGFLDKAGAWAVEPGDDGPPLPDDERTWREGTAAPRTSALIRCRRATPDVAREWLAAVWKTERAEERARFLETFSAGLSLADEAFLEAALDDRSAGVRAVAAGLLAKLPGSAFARRAEERAAGMLLWSPAYKPSITQRLRGVDTSAILDANPPSEIPKEWARDGISGKPPEGVGERAFRLSQSIALVPPSRWCARFASTPAELVAAAAKSEWRAAILLGWSRAAAAFADPQWALALWDCWPVHDDLRGELLRAMDRDAAERAVVALFAEERTSGYAAHFVRAFPSPWSRPLAAAVLDAIRAGHMSRASPPQSIAHNAEALAGFAPGLPIEILEDTIQLAISLELEGADARRRDALVATLRLRQRIHQEIVP